MRLAHISDLHFGSVTLSPAQFFSKRWLGNFNYLFKRKKEFHYNRLIELIDFLESEGVTHVVITGDLSVTSRNREFKMAKRYLDLLKERGMTVFTLPGNHDHYTRRSDAKKTFYRFFDTRFDSACPLNLKEDKITYTKLEDGLWLMGLDTALATSIVSSRGHFSPKIEEKLEQALAQIPKHDKVILINHFPFFENDPKHKQLMRGNQLKALLEKEEKVLLYLHGHTHRQTVADLRPSNLPILSDSGSTPHIKNGACHLFDLSDNAVELHVYRYGDEWKKSETHSFKR